MQSKTKQLRNKIKNSTTSESCCPEPKEFTTFEKSIEKWHRKEMKQLACYPIHSHSQCVIRMIFDFAC